LAFLAKIYLCCCYFVYGSLLIELLRLAIVSAVNPEKVTLYEA